MKQRCYSQRVKNYNIYGGRGIKICDEWLKDSMSFYNWAMANGYDDSLSIDRINNDGNYEPSNCRWATREIQQQNTREIWSHNKSGYRGVSFEKSKKKYRACISIKNKTKHLGMFNTALEAGIAYNNFVIENKLNQQISEITHIT